MVRCATLFSDIILASSSPKEDPPLREREGNYELRVNRPIYVPNTTQRKSHQRWENPVSTGLSVGQWQVTTTFCAAHEPSLELKSVKLEIFGLIRGWGFTGVSELTGHFRIPAGHRLEWIRLDSTCRLNPRRC